MQENNIKIDLSGVRIWIEFTLFKTGSRDGLF